MPQAVATSHIPIITTVPLLLSGLNEQEPLISRCINPILSVQEQMPEGNLHAKLGLKPKLNTSSSVNKEEKDKFLCAASGAAD